MEALGGGAGVGSFGLVGEGRAPPSSSSVEPEREAVANNRSTTETLPSTSTTDSTTLDGIDLNSSPVSEYASNSRAENPFDDSYKDVTHFFADITTPSPSNNGGGEKEAEGSGKSVDVLEELLESLGARKEQRDLEIEERPVGEESFLIHQEGPTHQSLYGVDSQTEIQGTSGHQQPIIVVQGGGGEVERNVQHQQIVIPIDVNQPQELQTGNTVLLPIIPTLMPDGKIEIRVAGNAIPLSSANWQHHTGSLINSQRLPSTIQLPREIIQVKSGGAEEEDTGQSVIIQSEDPSEPKLRIQEEPVTGQKRKSKRSRGVAENGGMFSCELCDYSNSRRYLLQRHLKSHSEHRPFICEVCDRRFKTASSLNNHINTHTGTKPFPCKMCEMAFTTSGELVRHIRYRHTLEKPHKCQECDYATVELSKLKRHIRSHTGERPFKCQYCEYSSPDTYKLKRHLRVHTGEKPYECEVCLARFTQSNSLKTHRLTHNPEEKPSFQCEYCPTTCGRKTDLRIHVQKLHESQHPVRCVKCGKTFPDRYSFKVHYRTHEGHKCFACPHCSYAAFSQRHLEQHIMVHSDTKPFHCTEKDCGKRFRQISQLRRHINTAHNPNYVKRAADKPHNCTHCGKSFRHLGNLKRHERMHADGEYDFQDVDEEEEEDLCPLVVAEKPEDGPVTENRNILSGDLHPLKILFGKTPKLSAEKRAKRKKAQKLLKRVKMRPEQLGLTNLKRRGRPKKVFAPAVEISCEEEAKEKKSHNQEDLNQSFGFGGTEEPQTSEQSQEDEGEPGLKETDETLETGVDTSEALLFRDPSGFPVPGESGLVDNRSLDRDPDNQPSIFDLGAAD